MTRKKFTREMKKIENPRGLDALLPDDSSSQSSSGLDVVSIKNKKHSKRKATEKISFNLDLEVSEKLKAYAFEKRIPTTEILNKCVGEYISKIPKEEIDLSLEIYRKAN